MFRSQRAAIVLHITEILYSLLLLGWFALPFVIELDGLISVATLPFALFGGSTETLPQFAAACLIVYLIPVICLYKIITPFFQKKHPAIALPLRPFPVFLNLVSSGLVLVIIVYHILTIARNASYFLTSSPLMYAVFMISVAYNAYFLYFFITSLSRKNSTYQEYLEFRRSAEERSGGLLRLLLRQGIQKRLIMSFVPLILLIIGVLSYVLMTDFSSTIFNSVIQSGKDIADRTAGAIKANLGDRIAVEDYLSIEGKKNETSTFAFKAISYYQRDPNSPGVFITDASTDVSLAGTVVELDPALFGDKGYRLNASTDVYEFVSPITLGGKLLGYVMVNYARDVIYEPYFRTQVKTFTIAAIFIYLSIFLIYVSGRTIVFPILFLRMSVRTIAGVLSGMVKGKTKISSDLLQFKDRVPTKDEIKSLSDEIGNMTTVIRGIVPYISASTLKHSERESPLTERKDLTLLFTDIRGFTTLCEGMKPDKVVEILNHYLDIQSTIIIENGGDVDKFMGDAIMATFDGPKKEFNACKAGMEIRTAMAEEKQAASLAKKSVISIGIGITTGPVVFGSIGAKDRMDFTSIGDTVNLASRLESANKKYGTKTLITDAVYAKVKSAFLCREIDMLTVKGKSESARIYELLQTQKQASEKLKRMKAIFEEGLEAYRKQKWAAADKAFSKLKEEYKDEPSAIFLRRISLFKRDPPERNWDGVFTLTDK
jgi:adenylate cyclase